jgi:hypothetical protein
MTEICTGCNRPLKFVGLLRNDVRGVEFDLMHCDDPSCPEFERTRSYHERPMSPEMATARKEALSQMLSAAAAAK